jgi:hypothetical protein
VFKEDGTRGLARLGRIHTHNEGAAKPLALVGSYALIAFADSEAMKSSWWTPTVYLSMPVRIDMSRVKSL